MWYTAFNMNGVSSDENGRKLLGPGEMFGDYTVEKLLGKGGMGAVYLVRAADGERYAVKVMDANIARDVPNTLKRFLREAEFAIAIRHPNLIPVHRVGHDPKTGLCYLVMDYMPGGSLADRLSRHKRLSVEESISIVVQIAGALEVAHRHGVIHRDIKPDNILFDLDGTPKLADMGVAKFTDGAHKTTITTTGMIIGTPAYMAPEQMMDSHYIDVRADIYALGVVLYEMLTGCRPHEGSTAVELLAKAIKGEPLPDVRTLRPEVSAALAYVLSLMCAPRPEERPSTPYAVVELVQRAENGTLEVPKNLLAPSLVRHKDRKGILLVTAAATLILFGGIGGWLAMKGGWSSRPRHDDVRKILLLTNTVDHVANVPNHTNTTEETHVAGVGLEHAVAVNGSEITDPRGNMTAGVRTSDKSHMRIDGGGATRQEPVKKNGSMTERARENAPSVSFHADAVSNLKTFKECMVAAYPNLDMAGVGSDVMRRTALAVSPPPLAKSPVVAIFVKNSTKTAGMDDKVASIRDRLAAEVSGLDFIVMDSAEIGAAFNRYKITAAEERAALIAGLFTGGGVTRMAQMLGADYILAASIVSASQMSRSAGDRAVTVYTLRMATKVFDATTGGSVYGKNWSNKRPVPMGSREDAMTVYDDLIDMWVEDTGADLTAVRPRWRNPPVDLGALTAFTVATTIDAMISPLAETVEASSSVKAELRDVARGITVEVDGVTVGSHGGVFRTRPGLHQLRVSRPWMTPWTGTVEVSEGAVFTVPLELSEVGLKHYRNKEGLCAEVALSYAEAAVHRGCRIDFNAACWQSLIGTHGSDASVSP